MVHALKQEGNVKEQLRNIRRPFPKYSFRNVALIHEQMPKAKYVAPCKKFCELGRNVIKG